VKTCKHCSKFEKDWKAAEDGIKNMTDLQYKVMVLMIIQGYAQYFNKLELKLYVGFLLLLLAIVVH
jgi:hypothetical protein